MLHQQIRKDMEGAMRERNTGKLLALRGLLAAFTNEAVAIGKKPDVLLDDGEAAVVIKRAAKQRRDSIEQFKKGRRADLAEKEEAELAVIMGYMPETMSLEEIEKVVAAKKKALGITDRTKAGMLIGAVMKELGERADGKDVKAAVDKLFEN